MVGNVQWLKVKVDAAPGRHIRNMNGMEVVAAEKRILPDAFHGGGDRHGRETAAAVKRILPDAFHSFRDDIFPLPVVRDVDQRFPPLGIKRLPILGNKHVIF